MISVKPKITAKLIYTFPPNDSYCQYHLCSEKLGLPNNSFLFINKTIISGAHEARVRFHFTNNFLDISLPPGEFNGLEIRMAEHSYLYVDINVPKVNVTLFIDVMWDK